MASHLVLALNSLGLLSSIAGTVLLYKGTWSYEPELGLSFNEKLQATMDWVRMEIIRRGLSESDAKKFQDEQVDEILHGATRRNEVRRRLNRSGLGFLILGIALQFVGFFVS